MTNAPNNPEPKKPPNPILNNFLSAAVFGAFDAALLTYLKTAQSLPENLRNPIYVMSVVVMMIVLGQFAFNTALFMHAKHQDELDESRHARELKELQYRKSKIKEEIDLIKLEREKEQVEGKSLQPAVTPEIPPVVGTSDAKTPQQTTNEKLDLSQYQTSEQEQETIQNRTNTNEPE